MSLIYAPRSFFHPWRCGLFSSLPIFFLFAAWLTCCSFSDDLRFRLKLLAFSSSSCPAARPVFLSYSLFILNGACHPSLMSELLLSPALSPSLFPLFFTHLGLPLGLSLLTLFSFLPLPLGNTFFFSFVFGSSSSFFFSSLFFLFFRPLLCSFCSQLRFGYSPPFFFSLAPNNAPLFNVNLWSSLSFFSAQRPLCSLFLRSPHIFVVFLSFYSFPVNVPLFSFAILLLLSFSALLCTCIIAAASSPFVCIFSIFTEEAKVSTANQRLQHPVSYYFLFPSSFCSFLIIRMRFCC